jgi:hypothetical protein
MNVNTKEVLIGYFNRLADKYGMIEVINAYYHLSPLDQDLAHAAYKVVKARVEQEEEWAK